MELVADVESPIGGAAAHTVHTIARIGGGPDGLMVATSQFRSANQLTGFKAAATVVLLDQNGMVIASSTPQEGWANGTWFGDSDHTSIWTFQFDPGVANRATGIAVLHTPNENYIRGWADFLNRYGALIQPMINAVRGVLDSASSSDPQAGGGGGGLGTAESGIWALMSTPWFEYSKIRTGSATATPQVVTANARTSMIVRAAESTGRRVDGDVYIGNSAVGRTDAPFSYTWNQTYRVRINPRTREREYVPTPVPPMTVRALGYAAMNVPVDVLADATAPALPRA